MVCCCKAALSQQLPDVSGFNLALHVHLQLGSRIHARVVLLGLPLLTLCSGENHVAQLEPKPCNRGLICPQSSRQVLTLEPCNYCRTNLPN